MKHYIDAAWTIKSYNDNGDNASSVRKKTVEMVTMTTTTTTTMARQVLFPLMLPDAGSKSIDTTIGNFSKHSTAIFSAEQ